MRLIKEYSRFAFNFVCGMIVFMSLTPFNVFSATHRCAENLIFVTDTVNIDEPIALPDPEVKNQFLIEKKIRCDNDKCLLNGPSVRPKSLSFLNVRQ